MTSIDRIIIGSIDVCNYFLQPKTTINNVWQKMGQLHADSAITLQSCLREDKCIFPSSLPEDSFFGDSFWPHEFAHHQINYPVFSSARKSIWHLPLIQIQERGEWRQEQ